MPLGHQSATNWRENTLFALRIRDSLVNLRSPKLPGQRQCYETEDYVLSLHSDAGHPAEIGAAAMVTAAKNGTQTVTSEALRDLIVSTLSDEKAEEIVQIDLRGKSEMGDYMVVASGRSTRQVAALAEKIVEKAKQEAGVISRVEGKTTGDWVLIDTGDVIVHLFRPEVREFYQIEKMWLDGTPATPSTV